MRSINIELLLGHNIGISGSYYKPEQQEILEDYINKAVNDLTIDDSYRLKHENDNLKGENKYKDYLIQQKLEEKDKQIEILNEQVKNIDITIGQRFSELFSKYGLVDYNNLKNNNEIKFVVINGFIINPLTPEFVNGNALINK